MKSGILLEILVFAGLVSSEAMTDHGAVGIYRSDSDENSLWWFAYLYRNLTAYVGIVDPPDLHSSHDASRFIFEHNSDVFGHEFADTRPQYFDGASKSNSIVSIFD